MGKLVVLIFFFIGFLVFSAAKAAKTGIVAAKKYVDEGGSAGFGIGPADEGRSAVRNFMPGDEEQIRKAIERAVVNDILIGQIGDTSKYAIFASTETKNWVLGYIFGSTLAVAREYPYAYQATPMMCWARTCSNVFGEELTKLHLSGWASSGDHAEAIEAGKEDGEGTLDKPCQLRHYLEANVK